MRFETADDLAVFFDPEEFGVAAVYRPMTGGALDVAVIHTLPTADLSFGDTQIVVDTNMLQIQRSQVARPAAGDIISLAEPAVDLEIMGEPRLDRQGIIWACEARELLA